MTRNRTITKHALFYFTIFLAHQTSSHKLCGSEALPNTPYFILQSFLLIKPVPFSLPVNQIWRQIMKIIRLMLLKATMMLVVMNVTMATLLDPLRMVKIALMMMIMILSKEMLAGFLDF
ncbi:hypothetical protein ACB098_02G067700 [Castanea mollissima]